MRLLFSAIVVLILAVFLAVFAREEPGYVMVSYRDWVIETSLALALIAMALVFSLCYLLLRFIQGSWRMPQRLRRWQQGRRSDRANKALTQGLLALARGDWPRAEKKLMGQVGNSPMPLLNYLAAARAAQQQDNDERRDDYLQQAHQAMPRAGLAIGLTQAELQLNQGQLEQALATLTLLRQHSPKHAPVLKLLLRLYVELHDWEHLLELLPMMLKRKGIDRDKAIQLEVMAQSGLIKRAAGEKDVSVLEQTWQRGSKAMRRHGVVIRAYVHGLMAHGQGQKAEAVLNQALEREWDEQLVRLYGLLVGTDCGRQIRYAEAWLTSHRQDAVLLLTLGRLCLRNKMWAQARQYLEASVALDAQSETCVELARLMEHQGETALALQYYRQAIVPDSVTVLSVAEDKKAIYTTSAG